MLNQQEIETIIGSQNIGFEKAILEGVRDYNTKYTDTRHIHSKRTRANIIRDHIVDNAKRIFSNRSAEGIKLIDMANGLFCIEFSGHPHGISGSIWIRFKKFNKQLLTSNVPTKQAIKFNTQRPVGFSQQPFLKGVEWKQNPIFMFPANMNVGYVFDAFSTNIEGIYATYPNGRRSIAWYMVVAEGISDSLKDFDTVRDGNKIIAFPFETEIEEEQPRRVRAKGTKKQNEQDKGKTGTDN